MSKKIHKYSPFLKNDRVAFTLIEIMMGVLIFSLVIIGGFKAYSGVLIGKIKLIESTDIQKEAFYFSEKFFEEIKRGGIIDYEEYFNRKVVGTLTQSGHYKTPTGFGNDGSFYLCRSGSSNTQLMSSGSINPDGGCYNKNFLTNNNTDNANNNLKQRYGEYALQFIDYNSNYDVDGGVLGDEDGDGNIIGDDDDEYLGEGPEAFSGAQVKEIYLISADGKNRTLFRWDIFPDEGKITETRGTIKFLKLEGKDWGLDHDTTNAIKAGEYDGLIDTWLIDSNFSGGASIIAGGGTIDDHWQPLFGDNINVTDVKFFAYPNKDLELAWKDATQSTNMAPYIRIQMTLKPSYRARRGIKGKIPEIKINTTISLTDIYSR